MNSEQYNEGQRAFQTGSSDNPNAPDTDEYKQWAQGYQEQWYVWLDEQESQHWQECLTEGFND